ncbi:hypothetical protein NC661_05870 [Aquibacillus koreensis]|uniref:Uncharacterized protein n=1 Tax=Aquibacillus koreensis TaxID=279446 RepID=A0A9X3WM73_9BACI|nr:hypothetical protein [Aquibacillus koreensis]MCT2537123.1 hypothetical protein [Aquibacillus koreensis]MDC3419894.1 hypothetical protein [Aquibacillus koreensis]
MDEILNKILNELTYVKEEQKEHRRETAFQSNQLQIEMSKLRLELSADISSMRSEE